MRSDDNSAFLADMTTLCFRLVFGLLFVVGAFFAMILRDSVARIFTAPFDIRCLPFLGLLVSGYFLWVNWLWFAIRGRFFPNSWSTIQMISVLNHTGWLVFFISFGWGKNVVMAIVQLGPIAIWIFLNLMLTGIYLMYAPIIESSRAEVSK
ncbi:MAG: hypothetical protein ACKOEO_11315 [Planctomycetaceae bacterium]|mgnify:CR=1 FL=1